MNHFKKNDRVTVSFPPNQGHRLDLKGQIGIIIYVGVFNNKLAAYIKFKDSTVTVYAEFLRKVKKWDEEPL